jgi:adenosylcobinamide-GDP ribazoletransferase
MLRQLHLFFCALQFLTRIPVPPLRNFELGWITRSAKYFPLIGQIVGALSAGVFIAAESLWATPLPALLAIAAGLLITGAFHEDGLADTADGLGGGQDAAQRLTIMKDSRIGTYGVLALLIALAIKVAVLSSLPVATAAIFLLAAHGLGRTAAVIAMATLRYAGDPNAAKAKPVPDGVTRPECLLAVAFGAWPLLLMPAPTILPALALGGVLAILMALTARRLIGGYTGDVLGAIEQVFEIGFLLAAAAAAR